MIHSPCLSVSAHGRSTGVTQQMGCAEGLHPEDPGEPGRDGGALREE